MMDLLHTILIRSTEKLPFMLRLAAIIVHYVDLCDEEFATDILNYVAPLGLFHQLHWLTNFGYRLRETVFERLFRLK